MAKTPRLPDPIAAWRPGYTILRVIQQALEEVKNAERD